MGKWARLSKTLSMRFRPAAGLLPLSVLSVEAFRARDRPEQHGRQRTAGCNFPATEPCNDKEAERKRFTMVTREEVIAAYKLILGRLPENEAAIRSHLHFSDVARLRRAFLDSAEFRSDPARRYFYDPPTPMVVQVLCQQAEYEALLKHVQDAWTRMGETEPMWSVLTGEQFKQATFSAHAAEFYELGRTDLRRFTAWLERNEVRLATLDTCFEFGCGVGRVTRWLSPLFKRVIACDISRVHLAHASSYLSSQSLENVEFIHLKSPGDLANLEPFDAIFSVIVLQHNPPPVIYKVLQVVLTQLRPGGVAYFQVPTYQMGYSFTMHEYMASSLFKAEQMEMHVLPQRFIFEVAAECDCLVLEVQPDNYTGIADGVSNTFLLQKRQNPI